MCVKFCMNFFRMFVHHLLARLAPLMRILLDSRGFLFNACIVTGLSRARPYHFIARASTSAHQISHRKHCVCVAVECLVSLDAYLPIADIYLFGFGGEKECARCRSFGFAFYVKSICMQAQAQLCN